MILYRTSRKKGHVSIVEKANAVETSMRGTIALGEDWKTFPVLQYGSRGEYVTLLQRALNFIAVNTYGGNWNCGEVDGIFGSKTKQAIMNYQSACKNLEVDGIVGPKTWAALITRESYSLQSFFNKKICSSKIELIENIGDCAHCAILNESTLSFLTFLILCLAKFLVCIGLII